MLTCYVINIKQLNYDFRATSYDTTFIPNYHTKSAFVQNLFVITSIPRENNKVQFFHGAKNVSDQTKITDFSDVMPFNLLYIYLCLGGKFAPHPQDIKVN